MHGSAKGMRITKLNAHRLVREDRKMYAYKMTEEHTNKRKKMFDLDGIFNAQNQHIWATSRAEVDERGGVTMKQKINSESHGLVRCLLLRIDTFNHL